MLAPTQPTLPHDHAVPMLWAVLRQRLQVAAISATRAENAIDLGYGDHAHASVKMVPGDPTLALLNFTENDSPSCRVSAEP